VKAKQAAKYTVKHSSKTLHARTKLQLGSALSQRGMKCAKVRSYTGEHSGGLSISLLPLFSPGEKYNFGNCLAGCPRAYKRNSPERHKTTAQHAPLFFSTCPLQQAALDLICNLLQAASGRELRSSHALLNLFTSNGAGWRPLLSLPLVVLALVFCPDV
jgi:hypothetical protein